MNQQNFRTYRLQVVVFFSFLALFSLIVAGIVVYGYRSNSEIMLKTSDELLYQISETVIRQTVNHLEPAGKTGYLLRRMIERGSTMGNNPELVEAISLETLDIYPQFSAVYLGDEGGNRRQRVINIPGWCEVQIGGSGHKPHAGVEGVERVQFLLKINRNNVAVLRRYGSEKAP